MPPIPFEIGEVVHQVNRARQDAEHDERPARLENRRQVVQPLGEVDEESGLIPLGELRDVEHAGEPIIDDQVGDELPAPPLDRNVPVAASEDGDLEAGALPVSRGPETPPGAHGIHDDDRVGQGVEDELQPVPFGLLAGTQSPATHTPSTHAPSRALQSSSMTHGRPITLTWTTSLSSTSGRT